MKLSIVSVTYNNLDGLKLTGASVARQLRAEYEWIVVDGGSTDGTVQYLLKLDGICQYLSEADEGIYDAMRKGLALASGDFVIFLNAGDAFEQDDSLAAALSHIEGDDVYFFSTLIMFGGLRRLRRPRELRDSIYSVPAIQQSTIYRTSVLRAIEWPRKYKICGDYYLAARLYMANVRASSVDLVLGVFPLGGISTTSFVRLANEAWVIQRDVIGLPLWLRSAHYVRRIITGVAAWLSFRLTAT
jgi:putative colanic acid biosynthesis glycosyltransferase